MLIADRHEDWKGQWVLWGGFGSGGGGGGGGVVVVVEHFLVTPLTSLSTYPGHKGVGRWGGGGWMNGGRRGGQQFSCIEA